MMYGSEGGLAPDTQKICVLDSDSFLGRSGLRVGQRQPPKALGVSVLNNSWIASYTQDTYNIEAVRRLDWMVQRDDVLAINSVDNGAGSAFPKLLASSYNGMAVGIMEGSSSGPITFDSRGARVKPDLVVPNLGSGTVSILRNINTGPTLTSSSFAPKVDLAGGGIGVALADLDGDGKRAARRVREIR